MNGILESNLLSENEILNKVLSGEISCYEILIRRNNSLLYKIGRSYQLSHDDVQDLMQETYITAFQHLKNFERRSSFSTWLARIMVNKCLQKMNSAKRIHELDNSHFQVEDSVNNGEQYTMQQELGKILEKAIENLPEPYRLVFLLREIEGLNVSETAEALDLTSINVKVRLNRAKTMLREFIEKSYSQAEIYSFHLKFCNAIVEKVLGKIA